MNNIIEEGKARIKVDVPKKISKQMDVFYNPVMKHNRDISILVLKALNRKGMRICLPLAGSGVRGIRFLLELPKSMIKEITFNDYDKSAFLSIKKNLSLNNLKNKKINIKNEDANLLMLNSCGYDYVDVDPFGSPNIFVDSAVKRISRDGILAVTATDTAALTGTYPKVTLRKYWATSLKDECMHETALRILIRKVQLIGAQFEKALLPIFSYYKDHYYRIFFVCVKGKKNVDLVMKKLRMFNDIGPMWLGELWDKKLVSKIYSSIKKESLLKNINKNNNKKIFDLELLKFFSIINNESKINTVGFYDVHSIVKKNKLKKIIKKEVLMKRIKEKKYKVSETHFNGTGIRSDISLKELIKLMR